MLQLSLEYLAQHECLNKPRSLLLNCEKKKKKPFKEITQDLKLSQLTAFLFGKYHNLYMW